MEMTPDEGRNLAREMAADLEEIGRTFMPFGRYGPEHFPPRGVPVYDLPAEYLNYFSVKGFPKGRLGRLLQIVLQMKRDGADMAFDGLRRKSGGRTELRPGRKRDFRFGD